MCDFSELTKLVAESQSKLLRYASHFLHDAAAAQDAVQNAYLRYLRLVREKRTEITNPDAWIFRATRNICLDVLKSSYEKSKVPFDESGCDFSAFATPEDESTKNDDLALVRKAIESLPPREREIVVLKFEEEMTYREIAEATGLTVSHVGNILHRAMAKIKTVCAEDKNSARRQK